MKNILAHLLLVLLSCVPFSSTSWAQMADETVFTMQWQKYAGVDKQLSQEEFLTWNRDIWSAAEKIFEKKILDLGASKLGEKKKSSEKKILEALLAHAQKNRTQILPTLEYFLKSRKDLLSHQGESQTSWGISNPLKKSIDNGAFDRIYVRTFLLVTESEVKTYEKENGLPAIVEDQDYLDLLHANLVYEYIDGLKSEAFSKKLYQMDVTEVEKRWPRFAQLRNANRVDRLYGPVKAQFTWFSPSYRPLAPPSNVDSGMTPEHEKNIKLINEIACQCVFGENGNELRSFFEDGKLTPEEQMQIFGKQHQLFRNPRCLKLRLAETDSTATGQLCYAFSSPDLFNLSPNSFKIDPKGYSQCAKSSGGLSKALLVMPWVSGYYFDNPEKFCDFNLNHYREFIRLHPPLN